MPDADLNALATRVLDSAFTVHRAVGPGLFESVYQACFKHELVKVGMEVGCSVGVPLVYDGIRMDCAFQMDMIVENKIIIENKAIESLHPIHSVQLLTYLRLTKAELGILINWNVPLLKHGIKRVINSR